MMPNVLWHCDAEPQKSLTKGKMKSIETCDSLAENGGCNESLVNVFYFCFLATLIATLVYVDLIWL